MTTPRSASPEPSPLPLMVTPPELALTSPPSNVDADIADDVVTGRVRRPFAAAPAAGLVRGNLVAVAPRTAERHDAALLGLDLGAVSELMPSLPPWE